MELTYACPGCGAIGVVSPLEQTPTVTCSGCSSSHPLRQNVVVDSTLAGCPWCGSTDLYNQKDFPQGLGLLIVVVGFVISTVFWYYEMPLLTYLVLFISAIADMILFYQVKNVTICYRCLSQYRSVPLANQRFQAFDLAIGERYRQEKIRVEQHRKQGLVSNGTSPT